MQISNHASIAVPQAEVSQTSGGQPQGHALPAGREDSGPAARASISPQSSLIHNAAGVDSGVRMDRVQALQSAIASGSYHVDAGAVADKIIAGLMSK